MLTVYNDPEARLTGDTSIRLVTLEPGNWKDPIHLRVYAVPEPPTYEYEALSYVWGSPTPCHTILVNKDSGFEVTRNLFNALRRLRFHFKKRTLWIDQICINQATDEDALKERAHQVSMMGSIYKEAACVNVWLGESRIASNGMLKYLLEKYHELDGIDRMQSSWWNRKSRGIEFDGTPWHERLWTMQEFALASELFIYWGAASVPHYFEGYLLTKDIPPLLKNEGLNNMKKKMSSILSGTSSNADILETFMNLVAESPTPVGCKDQRDLVFGILSLINPKEAKEIGVDYSLTPDQVSAKATLGTMRGKRNMNALCLLDDPENRRGDFPSWCLDFMRHRNGFPTLDQYHRLRDFSNHINPDDLELDSTYRLLTIRGFALDVVDAAFIDGRFQPESQPNDIQPKTLLLQHFTNDDTSDTIECLLQESFPPYSEDETDFLKTCMRHNLTKLKANTLVADNTSVLLGIDFYRQGFRFSRDHNPNGPRNAFFTAAGLVGFCRFAIRSGDMLVYIDGSELLPVLRACGEERYTFRDMAWVPGVTSYEVLSPRQKKLGISMVKDTFVIC